MYRINPDTTRYGKTQHYHPTFGFTEEFHSKSESYNPRDNDLMTSLNEYTFSSKGGSAPSFLPTPNEIKRRMEEIKKSWTPDQERSHLEIHNPQFQVPDYDRSAVWYDSGRVARPLN